MLTSGTTETRREQGRLAMRKWRLSPENRAKAAARAKLYRDKMGVAYLERARGYDAKRRLNPKRKEQQRNWRTRELIANPSFDIGCRMRTRIANALKRQSYGSRKAGTLHQLLGCPWAFFWAHIEAQFLPGMGWENRKLWHIDHIKPCCAFDLTKPDQQLACFNYKNLRPLWARDNLSKNGRIL